VEVYLPVVPKHAMKSCTGTTYCTEESTEYHQNHLQQMKQPDCIQLKLKSCIWEVHRFKNRTCYWLVTFSWYSSVSLW